MTSFEGSQVNVSTSSGNNEVEDVEPSKLQVALSGREKHLLFGIA